MAKEKPLDPEKEARKLAKAEKKAKRAETDGVHKSKTDRKDKKEKKIAAEAADVEMTTELLNTLEAAKPGSVAIKEDGDVKIMLKNTPLVGALVPFANPLADEKVGKKVLKSVKKGELAQTKYLSIMIVDHFVCQLRRIKPSNAASKKSSNPFANPLLRLSLVVNHLALSSWLQISHPWMSFHICPSCARITGYLTFSSLRGRNWGLHQVRRGRLVLLWLARRRPGRRRARRRRERKILGRCTKT